MVLQATHWKSREGKICSGEAQSELQRHQRQSQEHQQEHQQDVQRRMSEVQNEPQGQQVASRQEVDNLRHELSQCPVEGAHYLTRYTTCRSGVCEISSEIQQLRQERDSLTSHCRSLETEIQRCQSAVSSSEAQIAQFPRVRRMLDVEREKSNALQADVLRQMADNVDFSKIWTGLMKKLLSYKLAANEL